MPRLLVARTGMAQQFTAGASKQFIGQIDIGHDHPLVGATPTAGMFPQLTDMTVLLVQRGEHPFLPPFENVVLAPGDSLIVAATRSALTKAISVESARGSPAPAPDTPAQPNWTTDLILAEAVVAPGSGLIGRTVEQAAIHRTMNITVMGIERRRYMPRSQMSDIRLEAGDVLLVGGTSKAIEGLRTIRDLILLEWSAADLPRRRHAWRALAIFALLVAYAASGIGPIVVGALTAALAMILTGCLNLRQAALAFDRRIYLMVGATLAAGAALQATGGAEEVATATLATVSGQPNWVILSALFLTVGLITNVLSNNATAVLFTPIALGIAADLGADPLPFVVAVMLAASCAFATPVGYQTNMLVMGPGHYRFTDFVVAGLPLLFLMWVVFSVVAPWYYGV